MDPVLDAVVKRLVAGDHQGLVMLALAGWGLHRWWISLQPHICEVAKRLLALAEKVVGDGLKLQVYHHMDPDVPPIVPSAISAERVEYVH